MTTGERIQELRKRDGLSQEALGEKLNVSRQAISKWESDAALPEVEKLVALSRLFKVPVGVLLGVEEEQESGDASLTERELRAVEAVAIRYEEQKAPARWKIQSWLLTSACIACVLAALFCLQRTDMLQNRFDALKQDMEETKSGISAQVIQTMDAWQAKEDSLLADSGWEVADVDIEAQTVTLRLTATPKHAAEGTGVVFQAEASGQLPVTAAAEQLMGSTSFTAELTCPIADEIKLSALLTSGENSDVWTVPMEAAGGVKQDYGLSISARRESNGGVGVEIYVGQQVRDRPVSAGVRVYQDGRLLKTYPIALWDLTKEGTASPDGGTAEATGTVTYFIYPKETGNVELVAFFLDKTGTEYTAPVV